MSDLCTLLERAAHGDAGIIVLGERGDRRTLSYAELLERSRRVSAGLAERGVRAGEPVLVMLADIERFLVAFWGTIAVGAVPVPLSASPTPDRRERLSAALARLPDPWMITDRATSARTLEFETLHASSPMPSRRIAPEDAALLQLTSGSTGEPRVVRLSHANLCANVAAIMERCRFSSHDRSLSWLPLTHDMGLVGFHLTPLVTSSTQILMPASSFVRRPERWLRHASEEGASVLGAPCWALEQVLERAPNADRDLSLEAVRALFVGAEPIDADVCNAFVERFASRGLRAEALLPVYGLAEASLAVTIPSRGGVRQRFVARGELEPGTCPSTRAASDPDAVGVVPLGTAIDGVELRISDGERALPEGTVGRIEVRGASVTTNIDGVARSSWLDTGDLGFVHDGALVVTGRDKQVAFSAGETFPLHEIEAHARRALGTEVGACLVPRDGVDHGVVLFVRHFGEGFEEKSERARRAVLAATGLALHAVVPIARIPRTSSGKIRRNVLREQWPDASEIAERAMRGSSERIDVLRELVRAAGGPADLDADRPLLDAGIGSLVLVRIAAAISERFGVEIDATDLFAHPTLARLAERIGQPCEAERVAKRTDEPIAIVGMAVRVAWAEDLDSFWSGLIEGRDGIATLSDTRRIDLRAFAERAGESVPELHAGGWLPRIDLFEPEAFGLSEAEASLLAPGQRLLYELAAMALHDAGLDRATLARWTSGVFVGHLGDLDGTGYGRIVRAFAPALSGAAAPGNLGAFLAGRLARRYDLCGPVLAVDTACSSSLVALHLACRALRDGECDVALCGAARVATLPRPGALGIESRSERVSPFDLGADGTVEGEGGAVLVLAPLGLAQRAGLPIHAIVRASAVAHDGTSASITAPNPEGQTRAIVSAWRAAALDARELAFVETHGTGTALGDPIELAGLAAARRKIGSELPILLGALKSSVGHLQEAAGIVAVVKAALALRHRTLPGTLHHRRPLPELAKLEMRMSPTPVALRGSMAGVSSFGLSGTSAHVIVERAPEPAPIRAPLAFARRRLWIGAQQRSVDRALVLERLRAWIRRDVDAEIEETQLGWHLFELGLDSVAILSIRQALEDEFGVRVDLDRTLRAHPTLLALADHVAMASRESREPEASGERLVLATPRASTFRARSGEGPFVTGTDGRRYVDLTCGFGVCLFGHAPTFVEGALREALREPLGPMSERPERVAAAIRALTGVERVAFFSTGSEAVMVALRLARARTRRTKIAQFVGSYHGHTDGVLAALGEDGRARGAAPGVHRAAIDTLLLPYGDPRSLERIAAHAAELAAVLVEPVQSRRPSLVPIDFLRELRALTAQHDIALIFDEMITGFRCHPGGAQARFGVEADLVTYGKIVGGGLPIGVTAGRARYLDAIDREDGGRTFVAGTFNQNPLTMAAAEAVLAHLTEAGPELQRTLDARTEALCRGLEEIFERRNAPIHVERFSSFFRLVGRADLASLFESLLREGVYVWEGRTCFLSTAHGDAELARVLEAFDAAAGSPSRRTSSADALPLVLELEGALDMARLQHAWASATARHDATRAAREIDEGEIASFFARPFDAPLRAMLETRGPDRAVLAIAADRTAIDGWSLGVIANELAAIHDGRALAPAVHGPPASGPPKSAGHPADMLVETLEPATLRALRARAGSEGVSALAVLAAALGSVLSDDGEIVLAIPARSAHAPLTAVGAYTRHARLALRAAGTLRRTLARNLDALRGIEEGEDNRGPADAVLNLDRIRLQSSGGLTLHYRSPPPTRTAHPLVVNAVDLEHAMLLEWKWATDRYEREEITARAQRLCAVLENELSLDERRPMEEE